MNAVARRAGGDDQRDAARRKRDQSQHDIIEGRPPLVHGDEPELDNRSVAGEYFKTLGIPLLRGRAFTRADRAGVPASG